MWIPVEEPGEICPKNGRFSNQSPLICSVGLPREMYSLEGSGLYFPVYIHTYVRSTNTLNDMPHSNLPL